MEQEKNNKGVIALLVVIIIILLALVILLATGTISFSNKINQESNSNSSSQQTTNSNGIDSALVNSLYDVLGINWSGTYDSGDCLNYLLSSNDYKSNSQKIFSLYVGHNNMWTYRYDNGSCDTECKKAYSCAECTSILKSDADKVSKLYNFTNLKFSELPGFDTDYAYVSGIPAGVCHYGVTHDTSSEYIDSNTIRITDNQVATDYVFGEDNKINSTKNQVVTYDFKKDSAGNYYLDNVTVK